ncbi:hypothetical protein ES703_118761 [subsurface metagenome]
MFHNFSKLQFACNVIPSPKEINDSAYFNRWFPIFFDNQVPRDKQNSHLKEELLEERSGILNWTLAGLKRLLDNDRFSFDKNKEEVKAMMCKNSSPISAFVQDKCQENTNEFITKQKLYDDYCEYMREQKLSPTTKRMFGNNITRYCPYIADGWQGKERGWRNIQVGAWKSERLLG